MVFQGPIVRKDFLDKVGLPVPVTIDDWYTTLKAFKEKDPNGNGKADDIPLTLFLYTTGQFDIFKGASAFIGAWNTTYNFYQENGTVKYGPLDSQFKDFLATMAKWYKEGLIDPDFPRPIPRCWMRKSPATSSPHLFRTPAAALASTWA